MDETEIINPTKLATELGIREHRSEFGQGHLINWEDFWEMVEKAYWRNKCRSLSENAR